MIPTRIRAASIALLLLTMAGCAGPNNDGAPETHPVGSASNPTAAASNPTAATSNPAGPTPGPAGPTGTGPAAIDVRVVLTRSGGLAGISDTITVEPQGQWTRVDSAGNRRSGRLTDDDRARLRALATAPALRAEAGRPATTTRCRDAFMYSLTVDSTRVSYADCPGEPNRPQTAASIVALLMQATG